MVTRVEVGKASRRVDACPGCGAPVRVRKDGRYAVHARGISVMVPGGGENLRCAASERRCEQPT